MKVEEHDVDYSMSPPYLSELKTLVQWDYFCYRDYKDERAFDSIIDIGCNTGTLSLFTRILFPFAGIYSFDASPAAVAATFKYKNFFNRMNGRWTHKDHKNGNCWEVYNYGLGDGSPISLQDGFYKDEDISNLNTSPGLGCAFVPEAQSSNSTVIETLTLSSIIEKCNINLAYKNSIKLDCEGCECSLYTDENRKILRQFKHICGEIHFPPLDFGCNYDEHYVFWSSFEDIFDYKYFKSNSRKGIGHFLLTRKEDNIVGRKNLHFL